MTVNVRRLAASVLAAGALLVGGAGAAHADLPIPNPIGDAIINKICPPRQAPYPATPDGPVVRRGGGPGLYANYGYAGLRWTTYDAGCLSWDKADTSLGTMLNSSANSLDLLVNEVQMAALDDNTTAAFDVVIERALGGLRDAFWNPWSGAGLAAVGLLVVGYLSAGRASDMLRLVGSALAVVALLSLLVLRPHLPAQVGNSMTSGVAQGVAASLVRVTPGGSMPASATPQEKFGEGFYSVSYRAWLEGWACGDDAAAARYGHRLLAAQAFSVAELKQVESDPAAAKALVEQKQKDWLAIGDEMSKTDPVAFGCWKGEGTSRTGAGVKHAVVTLSAGFWVMLGSVTLLALKWVLRLALLFFVAFSPLLLFSRRMQERMTEYVLLGLLGPLFVAAAMGTLLWGYYAILSVGGQQAWWQAGVSAFALGLALWLSKGVLGRMFVGMHHVERTHAMVRHGGKRMRATFAHSPHTPSTGVGGAVVGGAAGGVAGAAVGAMVAGHDDDKRDADDPVQQQAPARHEPDEGRNPMDEDELQRLADTSDAPAGALARVRTAVGDANRREAWEVGVAPGEPAGQPWDAAPAPAPEWAAADDRRDDLEVET